MPSADGTGPVFASVGSFPNVVVSPNARGGGAGAVVNSIDEAIARVALGGMIRVLEGTYIVHDAAIDKPVTIVGQGRTRPEIVNESAQSSLKI
jgi:hypothetical protein